MDAKQAAAQTVPSPENLDPYLDLTAEDIVRLVLCLLIEERMRGRLEAFRSADQEIGMARFGGEAMGMACA